MYICLLSSLLNYKRNQNSTHAQKGFPGRNLVLSEGRDLLERHLCLNTEPYSPEAGVPVYCFIRKEEGLGSSSFDWVGFELRQCEPRTA